MIKVNTVTLEAIREELHLALVGLEEHTLQNLQLELDPVPPEFIGIEYWPSTDDTPAFDKRTHTLGDETLIPDIQTKTVSAVKALVKKSASDVNQYARKVVTGRMQTELNKDINIGGGIISNREELAANRDLLDGSEDSKINFESGHKLITMAQQNTIVANMKARHRTVNTRAHDIATLIKSQTTVTGKINTLDTEINIGWPT